MTKNNDLKKRVRERMEKTGEGYAAARAHVVPQSIPSPKALKGWTLVGSTPQSYTLEAERGSDGATCACVRSRPEQRCDWTALMQSFAADDYRGARLRFSARVRTVKLSGEAKLWVRVDAGAKMLSLNHSLASSADQEFVRCEIVMDVDESATLIALGMIVSGVGTARLRDVALERVGLDVPLTEVMAQPRREPINLDFTE
jgi:hypothetical protein